jgi:acetyltransferase-like isoleucine patch superfamily enzyme
VVGDHSHLSPATTLGGAVRVGEFVHMGIGAIAIPGVIIGDRSVVGAGGVVIREVRADATAVGVPARVREK